MAFKALFYAFLALLCIGHTAALNLTNSYWIAADNSTSGSSQSRVGFRRDFTSPPGKTAVSAQIIIAANNYTLYVNGAPIGSGSDWETSKQYCVPLNATFNVFALSLISTPATPIAATQVNFGDGSYDILLSDPGWVASNNAPSGFENVGFDDSQWPRVVIESDSSHLPAGPNHLPYPPYNSTSLITLNNSYYIWTNEAKPGDIYGSPPLGTRAFRKTINMPAGSTAVSGTVGFMADNAFTLYINGKLIEPQTFGGSPKQPFTFDNPVSKVVIAVSASNIWQPYAMILGAVFLDASDYSCSGTVVNATTDGTWKFSITVPSGFEQPDYDDSSWGNAVVEGPNGAGPYGYFSV